MEFSRQEYWSGLPFLPPGDFPNPETKLVPSVLQVDSLLLSHQQSPGGNVRDCKVSFTVCARCF